MRRPAALGEIARGSANHACVGRERARHHGRVGWSADPDRGIETFFGPEGEVQIDVKSRLAINSAFGIRYAALAGAGIVLMRDELLAEDIAAGRLQVLLPNYKTQARTRQILWPKNRKMTPKLRAFIDFIVETYG